MYRERNWVPGVTSLVCLLLLTLFGGVRSSQAEDTSQRTEQYTNPLLWEDLADIDILRVGNSYFYSASNMHYSPGAPLLRSEDLVHWRYIGHSVPKLNFGADYDLQGGSAYVRGTWASFLGYRPANRTFYWGGCVDFKKTYIYTAPAAEGPWLRHAVFDKCYYDAGLLVDGDTLYVAYGNTTLHVAQLSADGTREVREQVVFQSPKEIGVLEGSRFYKINGDYYIFATRPADGEYVLRSTSGPFGPYVAQRLIMKTVAPVLGAGAPHQGGIVQTPAGAWYYMAFVDAYPGGRIPVLAPLKWRSDGWPEVQLVDQKWSVTYPLPSGTSQGTSKASSTFSDTFQAHALSPEWEWNHNPDDAKWSSGRGLELRTATVTDDLYRARNTLTHRISGPASSATVLLDDREMKDGDCAGLALFRDLSAWIGVQRDRQGLKISVRNGITLGHGGTADSPGMIQESRELRKRKVWLRASVDIRPGSGRLGVFSYSTDGKHFQPLGHPFVLKDDWHYFMGYRFALFNYATRALGGRVWIKSFQIDPADPEEIANLH